MMQLLATAGTGTDYALLVAVDDWTGDAPPGTLWRQEQILCLLSSRMVATVARTRRCNARRIGLWHDEHPGAGLPSAEDQLLFAEHLRAAELEVSA